MSVVTPAQLQQYGGGGVNDHYPGLNGHMWHNANSICYEHGLVIAKDCIKLLII
jgi:hypothetical protein